MEQERPDEDDDDDEDDRVDPDHVKRVQEEASVRKMCGLGLLTVLPAFGVGTTMAFSVTAIPYYSGKKQVERTTGLGSLIDPWMTGTRPQEAFFSADESSWFVSILSAALMVGTFLCGPLNEKLGCLATLRAAMILEFSGWVLISFSYISFPYVFAGRILNGLGCGMSLPASFMLLSDVSLVRHRGIFSVLNSSCCNVGLLVGLIVGATCGFWEILLVSSPTSLVFLACSWMMTESPLWLVKNGKEAEATRVVQLIRGPKYTGTLAEVKEMVACIPAPQADRRVPLPIRLRSQVKRFVCRRFLAPLAMMLFLALVHSLSGADALSFYSVTIFKNANLEIDEYVMAILLQLGFTLGYLAVIPIMDSVERRKLFMVTSGSMCFALVTMGASLWHGAPPPLKAQQDSSSNRSGLHVASSLPDESTTVMNSSGLYQELHEDDPQQALGGVLPDLLGLALRYSPPFSVVLYSFSYGIGFGPCIYTWNSELYPPCIKGVGCSICLGMRYIVVFIVLKIYPFLVADIGLVNIFFCHAAVTAVGLIFVWVFMPETKGLTLSQLAVLFEKKSKDNNVVSTLENT